MIGLLSLLHVLINIVSLLLTWALSKQGYVPKTTIYLITELINKMWNAQTKVSLPFHIRYQWP